MRRLRILALAAAMLAGVAIPSAHAAATTTCAFGGPAGTFRLMRFELDSGSSFLNLSLSAARTTRPAAGVSSWHLGQGVFVLDEATGELVSYRISSEGTNPRRTVVATEGIDTVAAETPGPDTPFVHSRLATVPGLAPGSYLVAAFGSDGGTGSPNDQWGGFVQLSGSQSCTHVGTGELLDVNQTDFTGGLQVTTPAAAVVESASLERDIERDLVIGFMDASTQVAGDASLAYDFPGDDGTVVDDIVPFVSRRGTHTWTATMHGVAPIASVVALQVDP